MLLVLLLVLLMLEVFLLQIYLLVAAVEVISPVEVICGIGNCCVIMFISVTFISN
jgi:hypothetical protein